MIISLIVIILFLLGYIVCLKAVQSIDRETIKWLQDKLIDKEVY